MSEAIILNQYSPSYTSFVNFPVTKKQGENQQQKWNPSASSSSQEITHRTCKTKGKQTPKLYYPEIAEAKRKTA